MFYCIIIVICMLVCTTVCLCVCKCMSANVRGQPWVSYLGTLSTSFEIDSLIGLELTSD